MRSKFAVGVIGVVIGVLLSSVVVVLAGNLNPPGAPTATAAQMYTLEQIYNRLATGAVEAQMTAFTEPSSGPTAGTMYTLNDIMAVAPVTHTHAATQTHILSGTVTWGLSGGAWGLITGTMPNNGAGSTIVPTTTNQSVSAGYWSSANTVQGDGNLTTENIKQGVTLFGVTGTLTGNTYNAGVPKTGQTTSYATGDDGDLERGVAWPSPRFADNGDGTVTDNLTGLIWLKNADCWGTLTWADALTNTNGLASGSCGLTDASVAGDWRLPNMRELQSLIDYGRYGPVLPSGHPFTEVQSFGYWTGTTYPSDTSAAYYVFLYVGTVYGLDKTDVVRVWPVRGG